MPTLQMRKLRHREVRGSTQGHGVVRGRVEVGFKPRQAVLGFMLLTTATLHCSIIILVDVACCILLSSWVELLPLTGKEELKG